MTKTFSKFRKDQSGATAIEYGLIAAFMAVILIAIFSTGTFRTALTGTFTSIATSLAVN